MPLGRFEIITDFTHRILVRITIEYVLVLAEIRDLLLQVVYGSIKVASAVGQHVLALVAARLIVQDHDDHVPVHLLTFARDLLK